jgi:hypothetical protein
MSEILEQLDESVEVVLEETTTVDVTTKGERIVSMEQPTPQQLAEVELAKTRNALDSFYTDSFITDTQEELASGTETKEQSEEQSEDSIETVKRTNPQVGRAAKPKRQGG